MELSKKFIGKYYVQKIHTLRRYVLVLLKHPPKETVEAHNKPANDGLSLENDHVRL
jgi:hypothetical protein